MVDIMAREKPSAPGGDDNCCSALLAALVMSLLTASS
jgi:hypothetical protein